MKACIQLAFTESINAMAVLERIIALLQNMNVVVPALLRLT